MNKKQYLSLVLALLAVVIASSAMATNTKTATEPAIMQNGQGSQGAARPNDMPTQTRATQTQQATTPAVGMLKSSGISGEIASISGNTITLKSDDSYTITINASNATIKKVTSKTSTSSAPSTTISVSDLKVGDFITIKGNISVNASEITAGTQSSERPSTISGTDLSTKKILGTVTAIDNTNITIKSTQKNNSGEDKTDTYTVNASGATVTQKSKEGTDEILDVSKIKTGDTIFVQGEITDSTITATAISITSGENQIGEKDNNGIWTRITNFFGKMFAK